MPFPVILFVAGALLLLFGDKIEIPNPIPDPTPSEVVCVYLIHESNDGTQALTDLKADSEWKDAIEASGAKWLIVDDDAAEDALPNVVAIARKQGLPALVWVDANGLGQSKPCPVNSADMLVLLREIGAAE
jgi:hypothetical protein